MAQTTVPTRETALVAPNLLPLLRALSSEGVVEGLLVRREVADPANRIRIGTGRYLRDGSHTNEDAEQALDLAAPAAGGTGGTHYRVFVTYAYSNAVTQSPHVFSSGIGTYQAPPALPGNSILLADIFVADGDTLDSANTRIINIPKLIREDTLQQIVHSNWNTFIAGGGTVVWDGVLGTLSWTTAFIIRMLGLVNSNVGTFERGDGTDVGGAPYFEGTVVIGGSPLAIQDAAGAASTNGFIFFRTGRTTNLAGGGDVPVILNYYDVTNPSLAARDALLGTGATVQDLDGILVIAVVNNSSMYFRNGWVLQPDTVATPSRIVNGALQTRYGLFYRDDAGTDHVPDATGVVRLDTASLGGARSANRSLLPVSNFTQPINTNALFGAVTPAVDNAALLQSIYSNTVDGQIWVVRQSTDPAAYGWTTGTSSIILNAGTLKRRLRLASTAAPPAVPAAALAVLARDNSALIFEGSTFFTPLPNLPDITQFIGFNVRVRGTAIRVAGVEVAGDITVRAEIFRYTLDTADPFTDGVGENIGQDLNFVFADIAAETRQDFDFNINVAAGTVGLVIRLIPATAGGPTQIGTVEFEDLVVTCNSPAWNSIQTPKVFIPSLENRAALGEHDVTVSAREGTLEFTSDREDRIDIRVVGGSRNLDTFLRRGDNTSRLRVRKHGDQARNSSGSVLISDTSSTDESPSVNRSITVWGGRIRVMDRILEFSQGSRIIAGDPDEAIAGHINLPTLRHFTNSDSDIFLGERFTSEIYAKGDGLVAPTVEENDIRLTPVRVFTNGELLNFYEPGTLVIVGDADLGRGYDVGAINLRRIAADHRVYASALGDGGANVAANWVRLCVLGAPSLGDRQAIGTRVLAGDVDVANVTTEAAVMYLAGPPTKVYASDIVINPSAVNWVRLGSASIAGDTEAFLALHDGSVQVPAAGSYGFFTPHTETAYFGPEVMHTAINVGAPAAAFSFYSILGWRNNANNATLRIRVPVPPGVTITNVTIYGSRIAGAGTDILGELRSTTIDAATYIVTDALVAALGAPTFIVNDFSLTTGEIAESTTAKSYYCMIDVGTVIGDGSTYEFRQARVQYSYTTIRI